MKDKASPKKDEKSTREAAQKAVMRAIAEQKKKDPLAGLKIGAQETSDRLVLALRTEHGVHIETFLTVLAALAGFACQMAARERIVAGKVEGDHPIIEVKGADGNTYFFGDMINRLLLEDRLSVWKFAGGGAEAAGCRTLPDIREIAKHVADSAGKNEFGIPRVPDGHRPADLPINLLKAFWGPVFDVVKMFCDKPDEWPILFGIALNKSIIDAKEVIDPEMALKLVMEVAVPMSKVDPKFLLPTQN